MQHRWPVAVPVLLFSFGVGAWAQEPAEEPTPPPVEQPAEGAAEPEVQEAEQATAPDVPTPAEAETPAEAPAAPLKGPKFLRLRYDEDFSYLDGPPESYQPDWGDPIKNIHLGDKWRLDVGGELRFRLEADTNEAFGAVEPAQDTFGLFRMLVHLNLKYEDWLRIWVQGVNNLDEWRDWPPSSGDENRGDLQQGFLDLRFVPGEQPWWVRVGRQRLDYGSRKLITASEWTNNSQRFDGVKVFTRGKTWDYDMWFARRVLPDRSHADNWDEDVDFYGAYLTYKGIERHTLEAYLFAIDDITDRTNPNGHTGDRYFFTLGTRFLGKTNGWDYGAELAGQLGRWAGDTIRAWTCAADLGYTFEQVRMSPRLGVGYDFASGDQDPNDEIVGTADPVFGDTHGQLGFIDVITRRNVHAPRVELSFEPHEDVEARVAYYSFWLAAREDSYYAGGGLPNRRDITGRSGNELGDEIDITVQWQLDVHQTLLLGWSHFFTDNFIEETGPGVDADLFYMQYRLVF